MRNSHEAFRACLNVLDEFLHGSPEERVKFLPIWHDYVRSMVVHMQIEDNDMFRLLDEVSKGGITRSGLLAVHPAEQLVFEQVQHILPNEDSTEVEWHTFRELFNRWRKVHEDHFLSEEKEMMPLTQKVASTPEARAEIVHDRIIVNGKNRNINDFHFHIEFCVKYLSKYGSTSNDAFTATSAYVRGLKSASTPDEWLYEFLPIVKSACEPDVWARIKEKYNIESTDDVLGSKPTSVPEPTPAPTPAPEPVKQAPPPRQVHQQQYYDTSSCCTIN